MRGYPDCLHDGAVITYEGVDGKGRVARCHKCGRPIEEVKVEQIEERLAKVEAERAEDEAAGIPADQDCGCA